MRLPPYLLRMRFKNSSFTLWLPLFLIWPIALVFLLAAFVILLPFALMAMLFSWHRGYWRPMLLTVPEFVRLLCYVPGLKVDVESNAGSIYMDFR